MLRECYSIRKKLLQKSNSALQREKKEASGKVSNDSPEITRVSVMLLYLYQKIENELAQK